MGVVRLWTPSGFARDRLEITAAINYQLANHQLHFGHWEFFGHWSLVLGHCGRRLWPAPHPRTPFPFSTPTRIMIMNMRGLCSTRWNTVFAAWRPTFIWWRDNCSWLTIAKR